MLVALGDAAGRTAWTVAAPDGRVFAVFVLPDGSWRVADAACPHRGGPLAEGRLTGDAVVCPWHWYRYSLRTGEGLTDPRDPLRVHPVLELDGRRFAEVGAAPAAVSWSDRLRAHARGTDPV